MQNLGELRTQGNYIIEGKLISCIGQNLKSSHDEIRVLGASGISLEVTTDKEIYVPGDIVNIQAILSNKGTGTYNINKI